MGISKYFPKYSRRDVIKGASAAAAISAFPLVARATGTANVTLTEATTVLGTIPDRFMGLAIDKFRMGDGYFTRINSDGSGVDPNPYGKNQLVTAGLPTAFNQLCNMLSSGWSSSWSGSTWSSGCIMRLGGDKTNRTAYLEVTSQTHSPTVTTAQNNAGIVFLFNQYHLQCLNQFLLDAVSWQCIYALNHAGCFLAPSSTTPGGSSYAADTWSQVQVELNDVKTYLGGSTQQIRQFELGNEPDLYGMNAQDTPPTPQAAESINGTALAAWDQDWTNSGYQTQWKAMYNTLKSKYAAIGGPVAGDAVVHDLNNDGGKITWSRQTGMDTWVTNFAADSGISPYLTSSNPLLQHYYDSPHSSITPLIQYPGSGSKLQNCLGELEATKKSFRLSECNSVFAGGQYGFSDLLGSAFWAINYFFAAAIAGVEGVNVTMGGDGNYDNWYVPLAMFEDAAHGGMSTVATSATDHGDQTYGGIRPMLYAMLLFQMCGQGNIVQLNSNFPSGGLGAAYMVKPNGGTGKTRNIIIVNATDPDGAVNTATDYQISLNFLSSIKSYSTTSLKSLGSVYKANVSVPGNPSLYDEYRSTTQLGTATLDPVTGNWSKQGGSSPVPPTIYTTNVNGASSSFNTTVHAGTITFVQVILE